jgi:hypothetical protein
LIGEYLYESNSPDIPDRIGEPYPATAEGQDRRSISSTTSNWAFLDILRAAKPDKQLVLCGVALVNVMLVGLLVGTYFSPVLPEIWRELWVLAKRSIR